MKSYWNYWYKYRSVDGVHCFRSW